MPATYKILQSADHADSFNNRDAFALDVLVGLSSMPKAISSKYFYDQRGSELFRQISLLPEYYLTERELEIIEHHWSTVAARLLAESPSIWLNWVQVSVRKVCSSWSTLLKRVSRFDTSQSTSRNRPWPAW